MSRRKFVTTTVKDGGRQAPDLVERNFTAEAPDRLWVADITYIPTWAGFLYLAVVLDAFSRRIVGWSMATTLATQLVLDALNMALATRRPSGRDPSLRPGLAIHLDRVRPTLPRGGRAPLDGLGRRRLRQRHVRELLRHARMRAARSAPVQDAGRGAHAVFEFIEGFYNPRRRHSSIGYLSPIDYERQHHATAVDPDAHQPAVVLAAVKDKPFGRPQEGPSLTAAARDGRTIVRAGTEEWLRRGPNQRMSRNRRSNMPSDQIA